MSGKVTSARATDPLTGASVRVARDDIRPMSKSEPASAAARPDLRLIIEETGEAGRYIYTLVDRRTGKIVSQLPREHVLKLKDSDDYSAGAVFDGEA